MFSVLTRGAVAGAAGSWLMDKVTTAMLQAESAADRAQEADARPNGRSPEANLAVLVSDRLGIDLSDDEVSAATRVIRWSVVIGPAVAYALLRRHVPLVGSARGLAFGTLLFLVLDEGANTVLGLAGPPDAYPPATHVRGLVGHLVLGMTIDTVVDVLDG